MQMKYYRCLLIAALFSSGSLLAQKENNYLSISSGVGFLSGVRAKGPVLKMEYGRALYKDRLWWSSGLHYFHASQEFGLNTAASLGYPDLVISSLDKNPFPEVPDFPKFDSKGILSLNTKNENFYGIFISSGIAFDVLPYNKHNLMLEGNLVVAYISEKRIRAIYYGKISDPLLGFEETQVSIAIPNERRALGWGYDFLLKYEYPIFQNFRIGLVLTSGEIWDIPNTVHSIQACFTKTF